MEGKFEQPKIKDEADKSFEEKAADIGWKLTDKEKEKYDINSVSEKKAEPVLERIKLQEQFVTDPIVETPKSTEVEPKKDDVEQEVKKDNQTEGTDTQEKKEKAPEIPEFVNEDNKTLFEKLRDGSREFVSDIYEKSKMDVVDRGKIMFNEALINSHEAMTGFFANGVSVNKEELERVEKLLTGHEENLKSLEQRFGKLPAEVMDRAEKEKRDLDRRRESLKNKVEEGNLKLEYRNKQKKAFENRKKDIVEDVLGRVGEQLKPHEGRMEMLRGKREALDSEIELFVGRNTQLEEDLKGLEEEARASKFDFEEERLREVVREIKTELKEGKKLIKSRVGERSGIEHKFIRAESEAKKWKLKHNEFARISQREVKYHDVDHLDIEEPNLLREEQVLATEEEGAGVESQEIEGEKEDGWDSELLGGQEEQEQEENKESEMMSSKDYINEWNKYFGSEMWLSSKVFVELLGDKKDEESEKLSLADFEFALKGYNDKMQTQLKKALNENTLEKRIKTFRTFLKNKQK